MAETEERRKSFRNEDFTTWLEVDTRANRELDTLSRLRQIVQIPIHEHQLGTPIDKVTDSLLVLSDHVFTMLSDIPQVPVVRGLGVLKGLEVMVVSDSGNVIFHDGEAHAELQTANFSLPIGIYTAIKE